MSKKKFLEYLEKYPSACTRGFAELSKKFEIPVQYVESICAPLRKEYRKSESKQNANNEIKINETQSQFFTQGIHILLPCVHVPYEHERLMHIAMNIADDLGTSVKGFHIMGDFLDMNALSSHDKGNISPATLDIEYDAGNELLDAWEKLLPNNVLKTYIWGNHEDRYKRYMRNVDNAKLGDALQSPTAALELHRRGFKVFEDWKNSYITLGSHLTVSHGEFTNVHTAKKHLDTYRKSICFAHTHRKQVYIEGDNGAFNLGFMGDKTSIAFSYATRAMKESWVNSFGTVYIDEDQYFNVEVPTLYNNKVVYGGKVYR